jgi:hypothetical protein
LGGNGSGGGIGDGGAGVGFGSGVGFDGTLFPLLDRFYCSGLP